jgi:hypothetical protein
MNNINTIRSSDFPESDKGLHYETRCGDELKLQRCAAADAEREQGNQSGQNRDHAPRRYGGGAGNSSISLDSSRF